MYLNVLVLYFYTVNCEETYHERKNLVCYEIFPQEYFFTLSMNYATFSLKITCDTKLAT